MDAARTAPAEILRCRPSRAEYWMLIGAACFAVALAIVLPPGWGVAILALWAVYRQWTELTESDVRATDAGLRWCDRGAWKSARWDEVRDYYDDLSLDSGRKWTVETAHGSFSVEHSWTNARELRRLISERAVRARASAWLVRGGREGDEWPKPFGYGSPARTVFLTAFFLFMVAALAGIPLAGALAAWRRPLPIPAAIITALAAGAIACFVPAVIGFVRVMNATRRRGRQFLTASFEGIRFTDLGSDLFAPWDEVTGCGFQTRGAETLTVVNTRRGPIEFSSEFSRQTLLRAIIAQNAAAGRAAWTRLDDANDAASGVYRTGDRSEPARVIDLFGSGCGFAIAAIAIAKAHGLVWADSVLWFRPPLWLSYAAAAGVAAFLLWARVRMARDEVHCDDGGITHVRRRRRRAIRWEDVRDYYTDGPADHRRVFVVGPDETLRFPADLHNADALRVEIARRATNALRDDWDAADVPFA